MYNKFRAINAVLSNLFNFIYSEMEGNDTVDFFNLFDFLELYVFFSTSSRTYISLLLNWSVSQYYI